MGLYVVVTRLRSAARDKCACEQKRNKFIDQFHFSSDSLSSTSAEVDEPVLFVENPAVLDCFLLMITSATAPPMTTTERTGMNHVIKFAFGFSAGSAVGSALKTGVPLGVGVLSGSAVAGGSVGSTGGSVSAPE